MTEIKTILLVDDDKDDQYFFSSALEDVNPEIQLVAANNGAEALEKLKFCQPDLILVDLVMPVMNGVEFLKAISKIKKLMNTPIVVYTSDLSIFQKNEVIGLGASEVIIKAQEFHSTCDQIKRILSSACLKKSA